MFCPLGLHRVSKPSGQKYIGNKRLVGVSPKNGLFVSERSDYWLPFPHRNTIYNASLNIGVIM